VRGMREMLRCLAGVALLMISLTLASCDGEGDTLRGTEAHSPPPIVLAAFDSILLGEDEEVYIGNPFTLRVVPGEPGRGLREIWVSDFYSNSALHFDGAGRFVGRLGAPGSGPGEFQLAGLLFLPNADEVALADDSRREVTWLSRETSEYLRSYRYDSGRMGMSEPLLLPGTGWVFPLLDRSRRTSLGILDPVTRSWSRGGPLPESYRTAMESGPDWFPSFFPYVWVAGEGPGAVLVGFSGDDEIFRFDLQADSAEPLGEVPARVRRGLDECRFVEADDLRRHGCAPLFEQFSVLNGLWALDGGRIVVLHTDQNAEGSPPVIHLTGHSFITVMDPRLNEACVDLRIPGGRDARAVFDLRGGDLFVLDRRLVGDQDPETWLLRIAIPGLSSCPSGHHASGWMIVPEP
jgi:hypothetical protein